jgi:prefoldin subunit 5
MACIDERIAERTAELEDAVKQYNDIQSKINELQQASASFRESAFSAQERLKELREIKGEVSPTEIVTEAI